jgi:hypothetical protein
MKKLYRFLLYLHAFIGIGALFGGTAGILNPHDPLGIPADLLDGSPFDSYLIPSLILFFVIGAGHIFSAVTAARGSKGQGYISSVFSWALMIWIIVQVVVMKHADFLHIFYFLLGLLGAVLAMRILFEQGAFPTNLFPGSPGFKRRGR